MSFDATEPPANVHLFRPKASRSTKAPVRTADDTRPVIRLKVGELEITVDQAEQALIEADRGVYQRANLIVGVGTAPVITSDRRRIYARQILPIGDHRLLELITSAACFEKWDGRAGGFVPTNCPMTIVRALEQRRGRFRFPPLTGLVNAPTMRSDGSLLTEPGYDESTGLLFDPGEDAFPPIPDQPTKADAAAALGTIRALISSFPFVSGADRSVALATIITACVRRSIRTAPLFVFTAPVAGSGKSKLVDVANVIATGREAGVISQGKTAEETEKRVASLLLSGSSVAIDNVEAPIGGDLLCQLLTQTTVRMRVLGKSETPEMPTNILVTATGNNATVAGDMTRRSLICRLDPGVERPELREFEFEPVTRAKERRGEYLVAVLTVMRAYHVADRPTRAPRLGSFEEWSDLVRGAILWLGEADPVDTIEYARDEDADLENLRWLLLQWKQVLGSDAVTASDAGQRASERKPSFEGKGDFIHPDFREALLAVAGDGGFVKPVRLGKWLGQHKGRLMEGMKFEKLQGRSDIKRWRLVEAAENEHPNRRSTDALF